MEFILLSNSSSSNGPIRFGLRTMAFGAVLAIGLMGLIGYISFTAGQLNRQLQFHSAETLVREQVLQQQTEVDSAIIEARTNVNALALRLGELQADVIRLDALGERLVDMAQLDDEEFDFGTQPAMGGPYNPNSVGTLSITEFIDSLDRLAKDLEDRSPKLTVLEALLMSEQLDKQIRPAGRPVATGWMSSGYGYRTDPITGKKAFHSGADFAGPAGSAVLAVASGVVTTAGFIDGMGNIVAINHGGGYVTRYAHNEKNLGKVGDTIKKGQKIALMGNSGRSTGPHVHFEVLHNGRPVNPLKYVRSKS